jgi:DNA-binding transcriptional LysR family regulator
LTFRQLQLRKLYDTFCVPMIDLTLLSHALAVARHGNYARAADELGITPPTLSRQISALEKELGVRLFDRGRSGAVPTALGRQVLDRAALLLAESGHLEHEIAMLRGLEVGKLSVGAGVYPAFLSVGKALGRLSAKHPGLQVEVVTGDWSDMVGQVLSASLDLAVAELSGPTEDERLALEPLPRHPGAFFCRAGHPLLQERDLTLEMIFQYPFAGTKLAPRAIAHLKGPPGAGLIDSVTGEFIPSMRVNTLHMAMEAVAVSDAFGIEPLSVIRSHAPSGQLVAIDYRPAWMHTNYGIVYLKDRTLSPAAEAFITELRAVEAELEADEQAHSPPKKRSPRAH